MAKKIPLRQCLGCHESKDKRELIRVVKDSENHFAIDTTGRMNGRGAYICKDKECLSKAIKNKFLEKSFKMGIPADVYEQLKEELNQLG